jgi:hypothetical protein
MSQIQRYVFGRGKIVHYLEIVDKESMELDSNASI